MAPFIQHDILLQRRFIFLKVSIAPTKNTSDIFFSSLCCVNKEPPSVGYSGTDVLIANRTHPETDNKA